MSKGDPATGWDQGAGFSLGGMRVLSRQDEGYESPYDRKKRLRAEGPVAVTIRPETARVMAVIAALAAGGRR